VLASEQSHEQIQVASGEIEDVLASLSEIADAADSAANGITEVARATDSQATNIEEVTSTIQMAQEHATAAEASTTDITDATADQTVALDALADRVDALVGGDATAVEELDAMDFDDAAGSADADADADSVRAATDGGSDDEFGGFQFDR
jgi:methyl-accepting chemotaxis protein